MRWVSSTQRPKSKFLTSLLTPGFDHEQNRPDRDQYVSMHWDKIREDKKWNFQIMSNAEWNPTGHHYDFQSVMHYSSKNFAKNGIGPTMTRRVSLNLGSGFILHLHIVCSLEIFTYSLPPPFISSILSLFC